MTLDKTHFTHIFRTLKPSGPKSNPLRIWAQQQANILSKIVSKESKEGGTIALAGINNYVKIVNKVEQLHLQA